MTTKRAGVFPLFRLVRTTRLIPRMMMTRRKVVFPSRLVADGISEWRLLVGGKEIG